MKLYGLIGYPLGHSFSKKYFTEKFKKEGIENCQYQLFELSDLNSFSKLKDEQPNLAGLNVTIPYKQSIIPFLSRLDTSAQQTGAVNVIKIIDGEMIGFNSDAFGFEESLKKFIPNTLLKALILGRGGAAKAVSYVLRKMNIPFIVVSRMPESNEIDYNDISEETLKEYHLIINTTPLGMQPNDDKTPNLPFQFINESHFVFDLVYNPDETLLMKLASKRGAKVKNGLEMLHLQAEKAWEIWNS